MLAIWDGREGATTQGKFSAHLVCGVVMIISTCKIESWLDYTAMMGLTDWTWHVIICVEQEHNLRLEIEKAREQYKSLRDEYIPVSAEADAGTQR